MDVRVFTLLVARFTVAVLPGLRVVAREVLWALRLVLAIAINLAKPAAATPAGVAAALRWEERRGPIGSLLGCAR